MSTIKRNRLSDSQKALTTASDNRQPDIHSSDRLRPSFENTLGFRCLPTLCNTTTSIQWLLSTMTATLLIDANQYLDLYRLIAGKKLLDSMEEQHDYIFVSTQMVEEVLRNKLRCAQI